MSGKLLSYRNYLGSIEVSVEDNCLHGKVLFVNDLITYEAQSPAELEIEFQAAVDNYLEMCAENELNPDKPCSGTFNVRLSPQMHRSACIAAVERGISLNEFVKDSVALALANKSPTIQITENHTHTHLHQQPISKAEEYDEEEIAQWQPKESKIHQPRKPH